MFKSLSARPLLAGHPLNKVSTHTEDSAFTDIALLLVPGLIWGTSFLFIAESLGAVNPNGLTFCRILVGFLTLALVKKARTPLPKEAWPKVALLGLLWMAFPLSMFPYAEQHVSSALAGVLNGAVPIFAAIVASSWARTLPSRAVVFGLTVGLLGTVLIALPSMGGDHSGTAGVLMILAAVVSYGFAVNVARPLQQSYGALPVIWRAQAVSLFLTAPLGVPELLKSHWNFVTAGSMLCLGALGTAVAMVVMTTASGRLGATKASVTTFITPVVALILGVVVRGERMALLSVMGGAVCMLGAWLIRRAHMRGL